ncbi:dihydrofolate reductase family protein [Lysobacter sp. BMK333-48F3]|uniref:dihydrofolate reductase family protein n=1 Tax=Lysobacter sp. BMK333-48F3 TaxID=2867962 RepID=UPI001C8C8A20|nr:dihydrofolate reductase family protein [Lysobacter sp. BMK333-48F3]MBX9401515.1 dihydrofolate reductase family protein [Lysobacter sp. BMK333-48F3]
MRKIIAALQLSLDGYIEGPQGELDWIDSWEDRFGLLDRVDTFLLGARMYPAYEAYWSAIQADPDAVLPFVDRPALPFEIDYARIAATTPHVVLSRTLTSVGWAHTRIVRELDELRALKTQPGRDLHAVGGAAFIASLLNADLVDELCLVVHPVLLGAGKPLFQGLEGQRRLRLTEAVPLGDGLARLSYTLSR